MKNDQDVKSRYEAYLERRQGELVVRLDRRVDTVPITGRGKEWSKSVTTVSCTVVPFDEVENMMGAYIDILTFGIRAPIARTPEDPIIDLGDTPSYILYPSGKLFWSVSEAREWVQGQQRASQDTKGWHLMVQRPERDESIIEAY